MGWLLQRFRVDGTVYVGDHVRRGLQPLLRPSRVLLTGVPGEPVLLSFESARRRILLSYDQPWQGQLTVDAVRWLGEIAADRLGVPCHDDLDDEGWNLWQTDRSFRRRLRFDTEVATFVRQYPRWAALSPGEPAGVRFELDYVAFRGFVITRDAFFYRRRALWLTEILDLSTLVRGGQVYLLLLTPDGSRRYGQLHATAARVRQMRWIEAQVRKAVERAVVVDRGSRADVPGELLDLRQP